MTHNYNDTNVLNQEKVEKKIEFKIEEPNFTQTPNVLFDEWLPYLKEVELKVILVIYRKTFGWQKKKDQISLSQLQEKTGASRDKVCDAVNSLIEKKLITKRVTGESGTQKTIYEIVIQKKITSSKKLPPPSSKLLPTKERDINKEKEIKKENLSASEDAIFLFNLFENEVNKVRKGKELKEIKILRTRSQLKSFDDLLKGNNKDSIAKIIIETFKNDFWHDKMATPCFFKKKFTQLEVQTTNFEEIKSEKSKEMNIRWLDDKIKALTRTGARGNLTYYQDSDLVIDSILGKRTILSSEKMIDIVKSWDQFRRF